MSMKVKGSVAPAEPRTARAEKAASQPAAKKVTINKKAVEAECAKQAQASKKYGSPEEQAALHADVQDFYYAPPPEPGSFQVHYGPRPDTSCSFDQPFTFLPPIRPHYRRPPRPNGPGPGPNGPYFPNNPNPPGYILKNRLVTVLERERPAGFSWNRSEWSWALNAVRDFPPHRFTTDLDANLRRIWRSHNGSYNQFMAALDNAWY